MSGFGFFLLLFTNHVCSGVFRGVRSSGICLKRELLSFLQVYSVSEVQKSHCLKLFITTGSRSTHCIWAQAVVP